jgi:hypothetical protein
MIRLKHWEYWPFQMVYFFVFFYWFWLALKTRSPFFFNAANPKIRNGGMLGESKYDILMTVPEKNLPATIRCMSGEPLPDILQKMIASSLTFPVIAKPDVGERGLNVEKITSASQLEDYKRRISFPFIVQEYIDMPLEAGIFYYRIPDSPRGVVTSVVLKEMLFVTGDGKQTLKQLIHSHDRAYLHRVYLEKQFADQWHSIVPMDHRLELVSIGNHCKGTKFLNGNHLITPALEDSMHHIAQEMEEFYYGRFDVRARDYQALEKGEFMVMEVNGAGAEPAHIYDPSTSFLTGQKVLFSHWTALYEISRKNHINNGVAYLSMSDSWKEIKRHKTLTSNRPR